MLLVGAGASVIPTEVGEPLAGYALRTSPCTGSHDPLRARVAVIDDGITVVLVVLDLLYVPAALDAAVRSVVAAAAGADPDAVMVSATHTHAGPANLATDTAVQTRVVAAASSAAAEARATAIPAVLAFATRRIPGVSANRRTPAGRPDDRAQIIVAGSADGSATIATIVGFACHATVLDHMVTESSADFPGALCRQLERQVGGTALYLQGAAGDINPVVAAPTHDECERLGGILAASATGAVLQVAGLHRGLRTVSPTLQREFAADHLADCRLLDQTDVTVGWTECTADPAPALPPPDALERARQHLSGPPGAEDARLWIQQLRSAEPNLFGVFDDPTPRRIRLQRIGFGPSLTVLAIPGEPFTATARALRSDTGGDVVLAGYSHQSIGYLPPPEEWALGGYEVGCCFYTEAVEPAIRSAAAALLRGGRGPRPAERPA